MKSNTETEAKETLIAWAKNNLQLIVNKEGTEQERDFYALKALEYLKRSEIAKH
jgi:hypothetical protein